MATKSDYEKNDHGASIGRSKAPTDLEKADHNKKGPVSNKGRWPKAG